MNAIVIESHDSNGVNWLVSIDGPNPEPWQFYSMPDKTSAFAYSARLNAAICPACGSREILPPTMTKEMNRADSNIVTCDSCALDFNLPNCAPAAQDSPYVQIVTWDKHPKDAVNSQSAHDSPDA